MHCITNTIKQFLKPQTHSAEWKQTSGAFPGAPTFVLSAKDPRSLFLYPRSQITKENASKVCFQSAPWNRKVQKMPWCVCITMWIFSSLHTPTKPLGDYDKQENTHSSKVSPDSTMKQTPNKPDSLNQQIKKNTSPEQTKNRTSPENRGVDKLRLQKGVKRHHYTEVCFKHEINHKI